MISFFLKLSPAHFSCYLLSLPRGRGRRPQGFKLSLSRTLRLSTTKQYSSRVSGERKMVRSASFCVQKRVFSSRAVHKNAHKRPRILIYGSPANLCFTWFYTVRFVVFGSTWPFVCKSHTKSRRSCTYKYRSVGVVCDEVCHTPTVEVRAAALASSILA